jgi:hypothetical protein
MTSIQVDGHKEFNTWIGYKFYANYKCIKGTIDRKKCKEIH